MCFFFFNDTATTEIYTLSLHDALPICVWVPRQEVRTIRSCRYVLKEHCHTVNYNVTRMVPHTVMKKACYTTDRKSTRLNSSHANISYAVFCLKKKKKSNNT